MSALRQRDRVRASVGIADDHLTVDDGVHRQHLVQRLDLGVLRRQVAKAAPPYPDAPGLADGERPDAVPGDLELVQG